MAPAAEPAGPVETTQDGVRKSASSRPLGQPRFVGEMVGVRCGRDHRADMQRGPQQARRLRSVRFDNGRSGLFKQPR